MNCDFKMFRLIFVLLTIRNSYAVIYNLNDTEYDRLPPVFRMDQFDSCLRRPGALYCQLEAELVSDQPSDLLDIIQEYSERTVTHYNHSLIHWGVCVTKTCKEHLNRTAELHRALEGCLNESLHRDYRLQARLHRDRVHCTGHDEPVILTTGHYVAAGFIITILMLNILGSIYDVCSANETKDIAILKLLHCFSLRRNWGQLVMPAGEGLEPRLRNLNAFNGIKTIASMGVIAAHSFLPLMAIVENTHYMENFHKSMLNKMLLNIMPLVQVFFVMSGFLMAYNNIIKEEKKKFTMRSLPTRILQRWLRLTIPYSVVLAFMATWYKHISNGPNWHAYVEAEADDCRDYWYQNLLHIQTYFDYQQCMPHAWYVAADMQHSILGLMIFSLISSPKARNIAIGAVFIVGLLAPAVHTYLQDLDATILISPEATRFFLIWDPTLIHVYKRAHTNLLNYAIGIITAKLVYQMQENKYDGRILQKFKILPDAIVPILALLCMSGGVFYMESWQAPLIVRALYASGIKLAIGVVFSYGIISFAFQVKSYFRSHMAWRGWTALSRVSYCAYLVHLIFIKISVGSATALIHASLPGFIFLCVSFVVVSFIAATILYLLVESPFSQVVKSLTTPRRTNREDKPVSGTQVVVLEKETADEQL